MDYLIIFVLCLVTFIAGLVIGGGIVYFLKPTKKEFNQEELTKSITDSLGNISIDALSKNSDQFLKLAKQTLAEQTKSGEKDLDGKKQLIEQTINNANKNVKELQELVQNMEKERKEHFGTITAGIKTTAEETQKLRETADALKSALASTKARGQWGERMAEDVLRLAGFKEGVNYLKQKVLNEAKTKPDYTFILPQKQKVNMDVKFPLDNYLKCLESKSETDKEAFKQQFLKDVKARIKEITSRDYINPADNTVDYAICFIPNEQVYAFINEHDQKLMDEALKNKIILCSPITLYAILAVIRQAVDNFQLENTASKILSLLGNVRKQWGEFIKCFDKMGRRIEDAQKEFTTLTTTRKRMIDKPLQEIDDISDHEHFKLNGDPAKLKDGLDKTLSN